MTRVVRARLMSAKPPFAPDYPDMTSTEYPARQDSVAQAIEDLKKSNWCRDAGQDLMSSLEIVLAEALNNVVEHSCTDMAEVWFRLLCDFDGQTVSIRIEDNGRPMPGNALPKGLAPMLTVAKSDLPEGGFGWFLIRSICSEVNYARSGSINRLELKLQDP